MNEPRPPAAEGYLERAGVRLHWVEWGPEAGSAGPPLFLLHGLSSNAAYWERLARRFRDRRLVALDQRAHGLSDAPATGYAMEEITADAAFALQELELAPAVAVGHSWGASVALDLAAAHPELVAGLAVLDGALGAMSERLSWDDAARLMQPPLPRYRSLEEAYADSRRYLDEAWASDLERFVQAGLRREGDTWVFPLSAEIRLQLLRELYDFQPEIAWSAVAAPALAGVAGGDAGMRAWKEAGVRRLTELRPDVQVRWYDSRHDIPLIRTDEVAADLIGLCERAAG